MKLAGSQGGRRLIIQITYRFPHIGRKAACRSRRWRGPVIDVAGHGLCQNPIIFRGKRCPVGLRPAIESLTHALHFLWHRKVANPHFPQIMVHILTKPVKKRLAKLP